MGTPRQGARHQQRSRTRRPPRRVTLDDQLQTPVCSKCRAPLLWAATVNGKMQPLNREPDPAGNVRLTDEFCLTKRGVLQRGEVVKAATLDLFDDRPTYMPHFASCPFAEEFRKPKAS